MRAAKTGSMKRKSQRPCVTESPSICAAYGRGCRREAAKRQMTAAALVRHAVTAMLDDAPCDVGDNAPIDSASGTQVLKVTLRLPVGYAVVLASRARVADVSQGTYVARLIDGTPAQPRAPDHTQAVACADGID